MRTVIMSLLCSVLFAGVIAQAEEPTAQSPAPVVAKTAPKSGNENIDATAVNDGNFWKTFNKWESLIKSETPKDQEKAGQIVAQLIKGVYLVKFGPAEGFNPQTPGEFLQAFSKTSSLKSAKDRLGGASFFRTKRENNKLTASFLTEQPDQMKQDIEKNSQLVFISSEEITPEKFIAYVKSPQESLRSAANYWQKFNEWEALMKGKNGMPKDEAKAGQILPQLIKGVYLVKFAPAEGFNPQTPSEYLQTFNKTSSLKSSNDGVGGASFFRTKRENNKLTASFLTEQPDKMRQDIEKNQQLKFVSMEEVTPEKFIVYVKSPQESLSNKPK